jgi:MFS superfamily sulfate permease-like transporter
MSARVNGGLHQSRGGAVILDFEAVSDVDSTGDAALADLKRTLAERDVGLLVARAPGPVRELMRVDGVEQALGTESIFPTVNDAVTTVER